MAGAQGGMMGAGMVMDIIGKVMGEKEQNRIADILRNLPAYERVDVAKEQKGAIEANQAALPKAQELAIGVNAFNQAALDKAWAKVMPNLGAINTNVGKMLEAQTKGELSPDVADATLRSAAGKALMGGYGGSQMARNLGLRDLGLTSMQVQQQGFSNAMNWLNNSKQNQMAPLFNVSSMFITPELATNVALQNNQMSYQSAINQALGKTTPGSTGYWSKTLVSTGGQLMGMGMGAGGGAGNNLFSFGGFGGGGGGITGGTDVGNAFRM